MKLKTVPIETPLPIYYTGPDLEQGPLASVFYFALSAKDSLTTDPFHQAVQLLTQSCVRVFSVDLPFHGEGCDHTEALKFWAQSLARNENVIGHFLLKMEESLSILLSSGILIKNQIGAMGLSRGGFIASHIAARFPEIPFLLAFAPLTDLQLAKDFNFLALSPLLESLALSHLTPALAHKKIRVHIGNRDIRVSTDSCYQWIRSLTEFAYEQHIRSPHIELTLKPSIGHQGHGTSKESFEEGASWLLKQLNP